MDDPHNPHFGWLSATAQGDQQAFAKLYEATAGKLYAVGLRMLRRRDLAEEAVQEAFVRIWHNAAEYQPEKGSVLTWMVSILRYRALDILRAARRRQARAAPNFAVEEDGPTPESDLHQARDRVRIDRCLDALGERQRDAIQLAYFHGLTHQEVCAALAQPLGSVKSWIRRGLERLRRCLEP